MAKQVLNDGETGLSHRTKLNDNFTENYDEIALNTAKRHDAVTVTDTAEIDLTLTGQDIQADLKTTTVTPGSYTLSAITVDSKGRITAASNGSPSGTPLTTKGDLLTFDATDARLPVGTNGQTLVADSAEATGIKWATPAGGGDVVGPASATDSAIALFDGTTGKLLKDSTQTITDAVGAATYITGLVTGGKLTVNAGDSTLLDIEAATYYVQGVHYTYAGATGIANGLGVGETARRYAFDATGLVSQAGAYSDAQKQTILPISRINSEQGESGPTANIQNPIDQRFFISELGWRERKLRENVFLSQYTETGGEFSESSTPLQVNQAAGVFYTAQSNEVIISQEDNITANYTYLSGGIPTVDPEATLVVNVTQYQNGASLATMTDNYWKVDTLLKVPETANEFFVVMGNAEYATQTEAEAAGPNFSFFTNESTSGLIEVARFIVRKNNTNINRIVNDIPRVKGNVIGSTGVTPLLPSVSDPAELVNYEDAWRHFNSGGISHGGDTTDNLDGTFNIASCEVVIRVSTNDESTLAVYAIDASGILTPADGDVTYYYIDYNSGAPIWASGTDIYSYNGMDKIQAYTVGRRGNSLWIIDARRQAVDGNRKGRRRDLEWDGNVQNGFWHARGGSVLSASGLSLLLSTGTFYYGYSPVTHIGFDTTVGGTANANVFDYYSDRASYTYTADSKLINNTTYDLAGTPTALSPNRYRTDWVYCVLDGASPRFVTIMGDAEYTTLAVAELAPQPATLPAFMDGVSVLVGQAVAQEGTSVLVITTAFGSVFTPGASPSDHTLLSNLGWTGSGHTDGLNSVATFGAAGEATSTLLSTFIQTTTDQSKAGSLTLTTKALNQFNGANIASATTTDIGAATGNSPHITGTTTITGLGTIQAGVQRTLTFDGILILTHNATSLILPTGANITTVAGDTADFISEGSGNWRCVNYQRKDGTALDGITATSTDTLTNKRITARVSTIASSATPTPAGDTTDEFTITALAAAATFAAPTGTPTEGQVLLIRIKDDGTARALSWNAIYRASTDLALPTTTVISKTLYLQFVYNNTDSKWDLLGLLDNF